jgi:hypothetical protein
VAAAMRARGTAVHDDDRALGYCAWAPGPLRRKTAARLPRELELYRDAFRFLAPRGWPQARIDCRGLDPGGVAAAVMVGLGPLLDPQGD